MSLQGSTTSSRGAHAPCLCTADAHNCCKELRSHKHALQCSIFVTGNVISTFIVHKQKVKLAGTHKRLQVVHFCVCTNISEKQSTKL